MDPERLEYTELFKRATNRRSDKLGAIQKWVCWIEEHDDVPCIMRESGQIDGKRNIKKKYIKKGKNISKSNETTPLEQATFEINNMIKSKIEENMVEDISLVDNDPKYLYPALAVSHNLKKTEKLLKERGYLYVQPKLNGARAWKVNHLPIEHEHSETPVNVLMSRKLKIFDAVNHIDKELSFFGEYSPDGEIFRDDWDFQTIISFLKKFYPMNMKNGYPGLGTHDLQYHIYDLAIPYLTYEERKAKLEEIFSGYNGNILRPVETHLVETMEEIDSWNEHYIVAGYEGLIIRDPVSPYAFCDRNDSLIKYKKFFDSEYKIVGFTYEIWDDVLTGKMRKLVIWICETEDGIQFRSRPKGSFLERERLYMVAESKIGKMLNVRYQELSRDLVPIMNVSTVIRDYE